MQPNIVFITCHDLGRHLGCYGRATVNTPALDKLAAAGVIFDNNFCTAPQCSPSRATLHTGRHAHSNGVLGLAHKPFNWRLHPAEQHLAQRLKAIGYQTALVGLQHLTSSNDVQRLGYDAYIAGNRARTQAGPNAKTWIEQHGAQQPFYLEIGFFEPHREFDLGPETSKGIEIPPYIPDTPQAREDFAALQGLITALDDGVAMILDTLDSHGLRDNTWIIFAADHGLAMPRAKCTLYDPGIETALIMHWPGGGVTGGRRVSVMTSHVDVVPTVLEALDMPTDLHGRSLWPLLQNRDYTPNREIYAEKTFHTAYEPMRAIRTDTHKLIINLEIDIAINIPADIQNSPTYLTMLDEITRHRPHVELYDLSADPLEQHNLAGQPETAEIEADLKARLLAWMRATDDPILAGPVASPYYYEALRQLGV